MAYSIRPSFASGDTLCPDRFPCYGWRQIHKGGYIRWYGQKYYHDELSQFSGMWIYVEISDWLASGLNVFHAPGSSLIGEAEPRVKEA